MSLVRSALIVSLLTGVASTALAAPAEIAVPPGQHIVLEAHAHGFQVYECRAGTDGALAWALRAPAAVLVDDEAKLVAAHFGGIDVGLPAGPYWQ